MTKISPPPHIIKQFTNKKYKIWIEQTNGDPPPKHEDPTLPDWSGT